MGRHAAQQSRGELLTRPGMTLHAAALIHDSPTAAVSLHKQVDQLVAGVSC